MDMTLNEFKYLTSTCWNEKNEPLTINLTKDKISRTISFGIQSNSCTT